MPILYNERIKKTNHNSGSFYSYLVPKAGLVRSASDGIAIVTDRSIALPRVKVPPKIKNEPQLGFVLFLFGAEGGT